MHINIYLFPNNSSAYNNSDPLRRSIFFYKIILAEILGTAADCSMVIKTGPEKIIII